MSTSGKHMLAAALALPGESYQAASDFNDILDFVDDRVMNKIRYGETQTYASLLGKKEQLYWGKRRMPFSREPALKDAIQAVWIVSTNATTT